MFFPKGKTTTTSRIMVVRRYTAPAAEDMVLATDDRDDVPCWLPMSMIDAKNIRVMLFEMGGLNQRTVKDALGRLVTAYGLPAVIESGSTIEEQKVDITTTPATHKVVW